MPQLWSDMVRADQRNRRNRERAQAASARRARRARRREWTGTPVRTGLRALFGRK